MFASYNDKLKQNNYLPLLQNRAPYCYQCHPQELRRYPYPYPSILFAHTYDTVRIVRQGRRGVNRYPTQTISPVRFEVALPKY